MIFFDNVHRLFQIPFSELFNSNVNYGVYLPPESRMIFDYMIDLNTFLYHEWDTLVPRTEQLIKNENLQLVIPTVDIVRFSFLMTSVLIHKKPVLLTGSLTREYRIHNR